MWVKVNHTETLRGLDNYGDTLNAQGMIRHFHVLLKSSMSFRGKRKFMLLFWAQATSTFVTWSWPISPPLSPVPPTTHCWFQPPWALMRLTFHICT